MTDPADVCRVQARSSCTRGLRDKRTGYAAASRLCIGLLHRQYPEECGGAHEFLAGERISGYITGQIIEVNGERLMP